MPKTCYQKTSGTPSGSVHSKPEGLSATAPWHSTAPGQKLQKYRVSKSFCYSTKGCTRDLHYGARDHVPIGHGAVALHAPYSGALPKGECWAGAKDEAGAFSAGPLPLGKCELLHTAVRELRATLGGGRE
jgi:hypothetical protein